jgi:uncharacterized membrane protein YeiH
MPDLLNNQWLNIFGAAVFALSGALEARRKGMDVFGATVVSLVTALGGGTLRDLLLQHGAVFWVADPVPVIAVTLTALATFFAWHPLPRTFGRMLLVADAAGLAVLTILGEQKALAAGVSPVVALVMGIITGVAGGILRDILCNEIPLVLRREIYATAAAVGGLLFLGLRALHMGGALPALLAVATVFIVRLIALRLNLSLPRSSAT